MELRFSGTNPLMCYAENPTNRPTLYHMKYAHGCTVDLVLLWLYNCSYQIHVSQPHRMGHGQHLNLKWIWMDGHMDMMSMDWCKKDVTPVRWQWSYVYLVLTHRCVMVCYAVGRSYYHY